MIQYEKHFGSFHLLFRLYGSAWPRAAIFAIPSTILCILVKVYLADTTENMFLNPSSYTVFGTTMSFLLIFRINQSYNRYWEGCTTVRNMSSKFATATIQVIAFDEASETETKTAGGLRFRSEFIHTMSLMHALALLTLRNDKNLSNLIHGSMLETPEEPPRDAGAYPGWNMHKWILNLFTLRTSAAHYEAYWNSAPLVVLGGMNAQELEILEPSDDRVFLVLCWVTRMIGTRHSLGGIRAESSMRARVYQHLGDGLGAYENAYKLMATPFPFPYAQSVALLLLFNAFAAPLVLAHWMGYTWLAGVVTFISVFSTFLLNEVSSEIEEPFKFHPNDLPLVLFQHQFNELLVTAFVKSLFPEQEEFFFNQLEKEDEMERLVMINRPPGKLRRLEKMDKGFRDTFHADADAGSNTSSPRLQPHPGQS